MVTAHSATLLRTGSRLAAASEVLLLAGIHGCGGLICHGPWFDCSVPAGSGRKLDRIEGAAILT